MISFKRFYTLYIIIALVQSLHAQERTVENRPYCDLRPLHFGVIVGTHFQGLEFENVGTQRFTDEDGNVVESLVTCEQDRSDNGFHVGVLGESCALRTTLPSASHRLCTSEIGISPSATSLLRTMERWKSPSVRT